jgi:hypothetical protein
MIIIYHDFGGNHSSIMAASFHLDKLPKPEKLKIQDLIHLEHYDIHKQTDLGKLHYIGQDEYSNKVFALGMAHSKTIVLNCLNDLFKLLSPDNYPLLVDTTPTINILMKIGGFISRGMGIVTIGRPIVVRGSLKAAPKIYELVKETKRKLAKENSLRQLE